MIRYPSDTERHAIVGSTGSGKTQAALYHLSLRNYHEMPWVVYNWKGDKAIEGIPGSFPMGLDEKPDGPGVYVVKPLPHDEDGVEAQMAAIWDQGNTGIFVDEGYMIKKNAKWFRALLTQGRSKRVPMIVLSQRPVWMDKFVFSESEFYQIFRLQHADDVKNVEKFVPADLSKRLDKYHSYYYDVADDRVVILKPVPQIEHIHSSFARRLLRIKRSL